MEKFKHLLDAANQRLKDAEVRLKIEQQGNRLSLRGTLPPKPNDQKIKPYQQRISLGVNATLQGLKFAEKKAIQISAELDFKAFDWSNHILIETEDKEENITIHKLIEKFKKHYFIKRQETPQSLITWKEDYQKPFNRLPQNNYLTVQILEKLIIETSQPDTRQRKRLTLAYSKLADFAGLTHQLRELSGSYSSRRVAPRSIPNDESIIKIYNSLSTWPWRWAYGVLATYGLRNHELFFIDFDNYPILFVNRGKSGERYVWPIYPEWPDQWGLRNVSIPECTGKTHGDLGHRVSQAFRRCGIGFSPYNLRHAWAIRSLEFGLDISLAAAQMGHSLAVHTQIYHHWITRATHERAMKILLERSDRPKPPEV